MTAGRKMLLEAADAVDGDRNRDYGPPEINHRRTAALWRAYLMQKYSVRVPVNSEDVCWLNILQKASREMHSPTDDGPRDTAGYAANLAEIRNT
jgi:hypothetical protein